MMRFRSERFAEVDLAKNRVRTFSLIIPKGKENSLVNEETRNLRARLEALAKTVNTKEEWIAGYLREKPEATGGSVIGDYNPIEGLGERLGWFSFEEAEALIRKVRNQR